LPGLLASTAVYDKMSPPTGKEKTRSLSEIRFLKLAFLLSAVL
jgi:hypothetical protein